MERFDLRLWSGFITAGGGANDLACIDEIVIDSRRIASKNSLFVALEGTQTDGHRYLREAEEAGATFALVSRDKTEALSFNRLILLRVENPLKAFQEIAATYRRLYTCPVVAITGSFGKTMVKDLLARFLSDSKKVICSPESFNSQIGVALSLLQIKKQSELVIIEAAISQKGEMDSLREMIRPDYGILTHVGSKHREGLGSEICALQEMGKLMCELPSNGWLMVPHAEAFEAAQPKKRRHPVYCRHQPPPELPVARVDRSSRGLHSAYEVLFPDGELFRSTIQSGYTYFLDLVNSAMQPAWLLGAKKEQIKKVLKTFCPESTRVELWETNTGVLVINEPYSADPQSIDLALRRLSTFHQKGEKIFIFGGLFGEHSVHDYARVAQAITSAQIDRCFLIGQELFNALQIHFTPNKTTHFLCCETYSEAIKEAKLCLTQDSSLLVKGAHRLSNDAVSQALEGAVQTNQCLINLAAIETNLKTIRERLGRHTRLMPMVKAEAYGMHPRIITRFLETLGVNIFGVSYVDEALALRRAGICSSLFVLNTALYELEKAVEAHVEVGVSDLALIERLAQLAENARKTISVHLHVDTGMSRLGCRPEEALELAKKIALSPALKLEGIMTHFACADDPEQDAFTQQQIVCFDEVIGQIEKHGIYFPWKHAANSGAASRFALPQYNMARVSLALYGFQPYKMAAGEHLKLALSLRSKIVGINYCKKGETVSYGRTYLVDREDARIAVVPLGYFDGFHRNYSGKGTVIIRGQRAPMVGTICMDYFMVDVTDIPCATVGDSVLIFGEDEYGCYLSPEELAAKGGSISHELMACLGPRIQRLFIHEENAKSC